MAGFTTRCFLFFVLLNSGNCQSSISIVFKYISYGQYRSYTVTIDAESFGEFHECLCHADTYKCTFQLDDYYDSYYYYYDLNYIDTERFSFNQRWKYSNNYECALYFGGDYGDIICTRLRNSVSLEPPPENSPCQTVHLTKLMSMACNTNCIDVNWSSARTIINITRTEALTCGLCETRRPTSIVLSTTPATEISTTPTPTSSSSSTTTKTTTTTKRTTPTFDGQKGDDPNDDNIPLIVGVVVAVIVVLAIAGIIIVVWWHRKRHSKPLSTSHHYTTSTGAVSHNYENTRHGQEHVNGNGRSATNPYVIDESDSINATSPYQQAGKTVNGSYVSAEEVVQKKRAAAAAKNSDTNNQGTEYNSIDQDVPDAVVSPVNGLHNNDTRSAPPNPSSTTPASTMYSRLGEPVRNIQNPYDALQNPDEYSVAKSTPANSNTSAQYSFAGPATSPSSTQDSETVHNSTPPSQPTNRNTYGYEEVGVNNMTAPVVSNDYEESPTYASGDNQDGAEAPKEPDYTNFPVAAKNDYARLGEPMRNIQNPYDVMVNQKEDGPEESMSQAPPNSADDPYSLARPT